MVNVVWGFSFMKVAIIGANGQLGSDLVRVFGENAIPLTHKDVDVADKNSLKIIKEVKPDIIINTAAKNAVIKSVNNLA